MVRRTPRTEAELIAYKAKKRAYALKRAAIEYKWDGLSATDFSAFQNQFSSETVASDSRGSILTGNNLGNGAKWLRRKGCQ